MTATARTRTRTLAASGLVAAVLVGGVAGSATAAKLITGKDIKNNTVASADLKNNAVASADLKNGGVTGDDLRSGTVTGTDIADGSIGPEDLSNLAQTQAYTTSTTLADVSTCSDFSLAICPAAETALVSGGTYLVTVNATIDNALAQAPSTSNRCGIALGANVLNEARFALAPNNQPGEIQSFTLQAAVSIPSGGSHVELRCTEIGGETLKLADVSLSALKLDFID